MSAAGLLLTTAWLLVAAAALVAGWFILLTRRIAADAERRVPPAGRFLDLDGCRIHYVEAGQGPAILFVHGVGGTLHHFRHPLFADLQREFRLVALDRPGSGYSTRPYAASGAVRDQALLLSRFIGALGLEKPLVVGHSLGGAVALALALDHPARVAGLALIAPLTQPPPEAANPFAALRIPSRLRRWLLAHTVGVPAAAQQARATLDFVFGPQAPPADYMTKGGGYAGLRPSHIYATSTDYTDAAPEMHALAGCYRGLAVPVGVLFGAADRVLDPGLHGGSLRQAAVGVELELLDGIGHMPQFVAPERVAAFIRRVAARAFAGG